METTKLTQHGQLALVDLVGTKLAGVVHPDNPVDHLRAALGAGSSTEVKSSRANRLAQHRSGSDKRSYVTKL